MALRKKFSVGKKQKKLTDMLQPLERENNGKQRKRVVTFPHITGDDCETDDDQPSTSAKAMAMLQRRQAADQANKERAVAQEALAQVGDKQEDEATLETVPPVTLEFFMEYVRYEELVDGYITTANDMDEIAHLLTNAEYRRKVLKRIYTDFYMRPANRYKYLIKFRPCPKTVQEKIFQLPRPRKKHNFTKMLKTDNNSDEEYSTTKYKPKFYEGNIEFPVSFGYFKKYVNYDHMIDSYIKRKARTEIAAREWQENLEYRKLVLCRIYETYYIRPERRGKYPIQFKPCPKYIRKKILQIPTLPHASANVQGQYPEVQNQNRSIREVQSENEINTNNQHSNNSSSQNKENCPEMQNRKESNPEVQSQNETNTKNTHSNNFSPKNNEKLPVVQHQEEPNRELQSENEINTNNPHSNNSSPQNKENCPEMQNQNESNREVQSRNETNTKNAHFNKSSSQTKEIPPIPIWRFLKKLLPNSKQTTYSKGDKSPPLTLSEFKHCSHYNEPVEAILMDVAKGDQSYYLKLKSNEAVYNETLQHYYYSFFRSQSTREKYKLRLKPCPKNVREKILQYAVKSVQDNNLQQRKYFLCHENYVLNNITFLKEYIAKRMPNLTSDQQLALFQATNKQFYKDNAKTRGVEILSVEIVKRAEPAKKALEEQTENKINKLKNDFELICKNSDKKTLTLAYVWRTSYALKENIIRAILQMSFEEFRLCTRITTLPEIYGDLPTLERCYRFIVVEKKIWPINLYFQLHDLVAYLRSKNIRIHGMTLSDISPKFLHWTDLITVTNYDECMRKDYYRYTASEIIDGDVLQSNRHIYYEKCWTAEKWIEQVPTITSKEIINYINGAPTEDNLLQLVDLKDYYNLNSIGQNEEVLSRTTVTTNIDGITALQLATGSHPEGEKIIAADIPIEHSEEIDKDEPLSMFSPRSTTSIERSDQLLTKQNLIPSQELTDFEESYNIFSTQNITNLSQESSAQRNECISMECTEEQINFLPSDVIQFALGEKDPLDTSSEHTQASVSLRTPHETQIAEHDTQTSIYPLTSQETQIAEDLSDVSMTNTQRHIFPPTSQETQIAEEIFNVNETSKRAPAYSLTSQETQIEKELSDVSMANTQPYTTTSHIQSAQGPCVFIASTQASISAKTPQNNEPIADETVESTLARIFGYQQETVIVPRESNVSRTNANDANVHTEASKSAGACSIDSVKKERNRLDNLQFILNDDSENFTCVPIIHEPIMIEDDLNISISDSNSIRKPQLSSGSLNALCETSKYDKVIPENQLLYESEKTSSGSLDGRLADNQSVESEPMVLPPLDAPLHLKPKRMKTPDRDPQLSHELNVQLLKKCNEKPEA